MASTTLLAALMAVAVVLVVCGELQGRRWLIVVAKPLASACFVVVAWLRFTPGDRYGAFVLVALVFCLAGDALIVFKPAFRFGLASFIVGHLAFVAAFHTLVRIDSWPLLPAAGLLVVGALTARWLAPHLGERRAPVLVYVVVISVMVWGAAGVVLEGRAGLPVLTGALLFYLSDLAVARDRFVRKAFINRALGLPAYYLGQLLLAASVGG